MNSNTEIQNLEAEAEEILSETTTSEQAYSFVVKALSLVIVGESVKDAMFRTICRFGAQWGEGALERAVEGLNKSSAAYAKNLWTARVLASPHVVWSKVASPNCWQAVYRAIGSLMKTDPTALEGILLAVEHEAVSDTGYLTVGQAAAVIRGMVPTDEPTYDEAYKANERSVKATARSLATIRAEYEALSADPSDEARKLLIAGRSIINDILGDSDK